MRESRKVGMVARRLNHKDELSGTSLYAKIPWPTSCSVNVPLMGWGSKASCQVPPPLQELFVPRSMAMDVEDVEDVIGVSTVSSAVK
jgi:hypothetical protein